METWRDTDIERGAIESDDAGGNDPERVDADRESGYDVEREGVKDVDRDAAEREGGEMEAGTLSREAPAVVGVLAAAALSLTGLVGAASPADSAAIPVEAAPPPSETVIPPKTGRTKPKRIAAFVKANLDRTGHKRIGKASFYARMFAGRKMADGTPMSPRGDNAASLTLPLGTTAKVTNLETGKAAVVTIRDRGPYVDGRIVDLSPATARQIGLDQRTGVTEVEVAPITVPQPDGQLKLGDGALEARNNVTVMANVR